MTVVAITRIQHGQEDGTVKEYNIGDSLDGDFNDDELLNFVVEGAAVETGKDRKFTTAPSPATADDEATAKRDALIAESLRGTGGGGEGEEPPASPGAANASSTPSADEPGKTIAEASKSEDDK